MFKSTKYYIIIAANKFIIKRKGHEAETTIDFETYLPYIPYYYHLYDEDKAYIKEVKEQVKRLKMKDVMVILPDDAMDVEVDKRVLIDYFMMNGAKKGCISFQCLLLDSVDKRYIAISKTTRTIVMQYVSNYQSLSKLYYDIDFVDMEHMLRDMKNMIKNFTYEKIPVLINNINNDMDDYKSMGTLVSKSGFIDNLLVCDDNKIFYPL